MAEQCSWQFNSDADSVALARGAVAEFALMCGFYRGVAEDIKLAVGEACNNAVEHSASSKISVACEYAKDALIVRIEDDGHGFEMKPSEAYRGLMQSRGLGIFLMRSLMDNVDYQQKPGDGTVVTLEKRKVRGEVRV